MQLHKWHDIKKVKPRKLLRRIYYAVRNFVWGGYHRGGISGVWHYIRCHTYNRYHIINLSGMDGYTWGWIDSDNKMELACWNILVDFVENEDPSVGTVSTPDGFWPDKRVWYPGEKESLQLQIDKGLEVRALYDWWTKTYPQRKADVAKIKNSRDRYPSEVVLDAERTEMLCRLIRIRDCLWT